MPLNNGNFCVNEASSDISSFLSFEYFLSFPQTLLAEERRKLKEGEEEEGEVFLSSSFHTWPPVLSLIVSDSSVLLSCTYS